MEIDLDFGVTLILNKIPKTIEDLKKEVSTKGVQDLLEGALDNIKKHNISLSESDERSVREIKWAVYQDGFKVQEKRFDIPKGVFKQSALLNKMLSDIQSYLSQIDD